MNVYLVGHVVLYRIDERIVRRLGQLHEFLDVCRGIEFLLRLRMNLATLGIFIEPKQIRHRPREIAWFTINHPRLQIARLAPMIDILLSRIGNRLANFGQHLFVRQREIVPCTTKNFELHARAIGDGRV